MGKSKALAQSFPETLVYKWLDRLKDSKGIVLPVLHPSSSARQLKAVKEVTQNLTTLDLDYILALFQIEIELRQEECKECSEVLSVLVEVHSVCAAKHPLQRTISR